MQPIIFLLGSLLLIHFSSLKGKQTRETSSYSRNSSFIGSQCLHWDHLHCYPGWTHPPQPHHIRSLAKALHIEFALPDKRGLQSVHRPKSLGEKLACEEWWVSSFWGPRCLVQQNLSWSPMQIRREAGYQRAAQNPSQSRKGFLHIKHTNILSSLVICLLYIYPLWNVSITKAEILFTLFILCS